MPGNEVIWIIKQIILPPGGLILLGLLGLMLSGRFSGKFLILISVASLYIFSTPVFVEMMARQLEHIPPLDMRSLESKRAQAILVLGGGRYNDAPEYAGDTVNATLLERLRYTARLARSTRLPVIISGGSKQDQGDSEADLAKSVLEQDFGIRVYAIEERSRTTWDNAHYSAELLERLKINHVLLVTHAWHMPRALSVFRELDLAVTPAPMGYIGQAPFTTTAWDWLPSAASLHQSYWITHELLGKYWYEVRHFIHKRNR